MKSADKLLVKENKFFEFMPGNRLGFYFILLIEIISVIALIVTKEVYLWIIVLLGLLISIPSIVKLFKLSRREPQVFSLALEDNNLIVEYGDNKHKLPLNQVKALILKPRKHNRRVSYDLICRCDKKDKVLVEDIAPGIFSTQNISLIEEFFSKAALDVELILFDPAQFHV